MYYKVNELGVLNRVLTRESDYLTKEEYDIIKKQVTKHPEIDDLNKMLDTYVKHKVQNKPYCISKIKVVDTAYYDKRYESFTSIEFLVSILDEDDKFVKNIIIQESGFREEYIRHVNDFLKKLHKKTTFVLKGVERIHYYVNGINVYQFAVPEYLDYIRNVDKEMAKINELLDYYKDNLVEIQEDKDYLSDMNSVDEFLAGLLK